MSSPPTSSTPPKSARPLLPDGGRPTAPPPEWFAHLVEFENGLTPDTATPRPHPEGIVRGDTADDPPVRAVTVSGTVRSPASAPVHERAVNVTFVSTTGSGGPEEGYAADADADPTEETG